VRRPPASTPVARNTAPISLTSEQNQDVLSLIGSGQRMEAIQRYRELSGARIEQAVLAVTEMASRLGDSGARPSATISPEVAKQAEGEALASIREGKTGEAVRRYQRYSTLSLRESKLAVNALVLVHLSQGRVSAKVAHSLIPLLSDGKKQEAVSQLLETTAYGKTEAVAFIEDAERAIRRDGMAAMGASAVGPAWLLVGLGLLALLLTAAAFLAFS
jgi:hypothetical protein